ncbi:MAG: UDP-2,3-diacylglucosamine diphosphatase [Gammaproteobacteria bacterium]|nr:UDP-2,3-diacylglucosamine diphosphatase [Gammaproteobacteria bacterium]
MSERILLISDLHLEEKRPDITAAFKNFLLANHRKCTSLYILGDLFEVWIGDDVTTSLSEEIGDALKKFRDAGSNIYLMHGNRDFLIGNSYTQRFGATIIEEPFKLKTGNFAALLLHGDVLCTDDVDYQQFRSMVRNSNWQDNFLAQTIEERITYAREARRQSQLATMQKPNNIMDVNASAVDSIFIRSQQSIIIHGHTHRPATHKVALDTAHSSVAEGKRIVLGDWNEKVWYVEIQNNEAELCSAPFAH